MTTPNSKNIRKSKYSSHSDMEDYGNFIDGFENAPEKEKSKHPSNKFTFFENQQNKVIDKKKYILISLIIISVLFLGVGAYLLIFPERTVKGNLSTSSTPEDIPGKINPDPVSDDQYQCSVCRKVLAKNIYEYKHYIEEADITLYFDTERCYKRFLDNPDLYFETKKKINVKVVVKPSPEQLMTPEEITDPVDAPYADTAPKNQEETTEELAPQEDGVQQDVKAGLPMQKEPKNARQPVKMPAKAVEDVPSKSLLGSPMKIGQPQKANPLVKSGKPPIPNEVHDSEILNNPNTPHSGQMKPEQKPYTAPEQKSPSDSWGEMPDPGKIPEITLPPGAAPKKKEEKPKLKTTPIELPSGAENHSF